MYTRAQPFWKAENKKRHCAIAFSQFVNVYGLQQEQPHAG